MVKSYKIILVIIAFCVRNSFAQYPRIPCPDIFRYARSSEGYFGKINLDGIDYGVTEVEVELSQPGQKNPDFTGRLELAIDVNDVRNYIEENRLIPFRVLFQFPDVIPYLTAIRVNGASVCSGPKVSTRPRVNIRLKRTLTINEPKSRENPYEEVTTRKTNSVYAYSPYSPTTPRIITSITPPPPKATTTTTTTTSTTTPPPIIQTISKPLPGTMEYINSVCGIENEIPITTKLSHFGEFIRKARFPWIVAIYKKSLGKVEFKCGASLISTSTIVTAAHCFYEDHYVIKDSDILVSLGRHDVNDWADSTAIQRNVERVIQHPDYKPEIPRSDADIAIVRLQSRVAFSATIRPICLWEGSTDIEDIVGLAGIVVGWGSDENNKSLSSTPKLVNATVADDVTCLKSSIDFFFFTSNRTMCAGNLDDSGPCTGDSGSGLMLRMGNKWLMRGIVSLALGTESEPCNLKKYVIYTDTTHFLDWIRGNMLL